MNLNGRKVMILGGPGLVGMAVARRLLECELAEIQIHGLYEDEVEIAAARLRTEAGSIRVTTSHGDIFGLVEQVTKDETLAAELRELKDEALPEYSLFSLLLESRPDALIDCVNTATAIAYRDIYRSAEALCDELGSTVTTESARTLLEALYIPRLIRHVQVLYRGMLEANVGAYIKVGTTGTGGMGLNVPYTHSEEKPSRVLLSKGAVAGAHSSLLFLMARTPGGPIVKEIKPAAAIAWKELGFGPILRGRDPIRIASSVKQPLGDTFSSVDESAGEVTDELLETAFINTGENGIFSLEEFALLTTAEQMEFVTPEEIAENLVFELEGGNTGHDLINALDGAVLGPTYRAGVMRHWAVKRMTDLEKKGSTRSVAFEMLGPPRNSKLLFEAHLLREAFHSMTAVRDSNPDEITRRLNELVLEKPRLADEISTIGLPVLLESGEILRGPQVIVPGHANDEPVTPENLERWARDGWVDLRRANCEHWWSRVKAVFDELDALPPDDTSSRYFRHRDFWRLDQIQPGRLVGWVLTGEEDGSRRKR